VAKWKLTVRNGSDVNRQGYDDLEEAVEASRLLAKGIVAEGPMDRVQSLRDFEPAQQIKARIEIAGKGLLRPPTAGVDIHGDGSLQAFEGAVVRKPLPSGSVKEVFDSIRQSLS